MNYVRNSRRELTGCEHQITAPLIYSLLCFTGIIIEIDKTNYKKNYLLLQEGPIILKAKMSFLNDEDTLKGESTDYPCWLYS